MPGRIYICIVLLVLAGSSYAGPCDSDAHRAFDFWIGDWRVTTPEGKFAGTNHIISQYGGCVIHEHYITGRGYSGESLNSYDAGRGVWHQTWVDNGGTLLMLEGGMKNGIMVLQGSTHGEDGKQTRHRISWTPNEDGSVRQHWESMDDKGQWQTAFDGMYTKK